MSRWADSGTAAFSDPFGILIGRTYPGLPGTAWDFHRSVWPALVSRRNHQSPRRSATTNRILSPRERDCLPPRASAGTRAWHTVEAESWLLPNYPCLAPPSWDVATPSWLRTLPEGRFGQGFPYGHGPARVGLDRSGWIGRTVCRTQPPTPAVHAVPRSPEILRLVVTSLQASAIPSGPSPR